MPPLPPIAATWRAEVRMTLHGQQIENVLHYIQNGPVTEAEANLFAAEVSDAYVLNILPRLSNQLVVREVFVTHLGATPQVVGVYSSGGNDVGGIAGESLPGNCAICLTLRTGLAGRSYRGRIYLPGIPESVVANATADPAWLSATVTGAQALLDLSTAESTYELAIASYYSGGQLRAEGISTLVNSITARDSTVDSQRRRLPGRGR